MSNALIGYSGFVGGNIYRQSDQFDALYDATNIEDIKGRHFDLLVCSGAPAVKWWANQNPQEDWANIQRLLDCLESVNAKQVVQISTVDVFKEPIDVDEYSKIIVEGLDPYGKHRFLLEEYVRKQFPKTLVVRLPGLFGRGLKKNFIYDLLNNNALHLTDYRSVFQFYNLDEIWLDIQRALQLELNTIHLTTEPISAGNVAKEAFNLDFMNITSKPPVSYNLLSAHSQVMGSVQPNYLKSRAQVISEIKNFAANYHSS